MTDSNSMESPQYRRHESSRDINDLLLNGYYKTSRARSPSTSTPSTPAVTYSSAPSFLNAHDVEPRRHRSRSRSQGPRRPPPKPTCEDEVESLAREFSTTSVGSSDHEPPMRGIVEQYPILLEAHVTADEAARLHAEPRKEDDSDNGERRFVLIPRSDTHSPNREDGYGKADTSKGARTQEERAPRERRDHGRKEDKRTSVPASPIERPRQRQEPDRRDEKRASGPAQPTERPRPKPEAAQDNRLPIPHPPLERRRSRQELPALKTKEIPPQFRRSHSAYTASPSAGDLPKASPKITRTPSEYMLSPDVINSGRGAKGYFDAASAPRYHPLHETSGVWPTSHGNKRNSGGSNPGSSRPTTPEKEKRGSGTFENTSRSRRNSIEKLTRPQLLSEEYGTRRHHHRTPSTHSERPRSPRSSGHSFRHYYSSDEEDLAGSSDSDRRRRRHHNTQHKHSLHPDDDQNRHRRSTSISRQSTLDHKPQTRHTPPLPSPNISPSQISRGDEKQRAETFPRTRENGRPTSRPVSPNDPTSPSEDTRASDRLNSLDPAARPKPSRHPSAANGTSQMSLPISIPSRIDLHSPGETRRSFASPRTEEPRSPAIRSPSEGKSFWQPPSFQPPASTSTLEKPVGSYRRYSEDIQRGSIAPLPTCPRTSFTRGHNDWLTLPNLDGFNICPSCYNTTMATTEFRDHFVQSSIRSSNAEIICDFGSSPWYRIAWLLTLKERRRDLNLFYGLTQIARSLQPCLGRHEAIRQWHSILDPRTGAPIRNFDVCTSCVKSVETLLPSIRGIFVRIDSHPAGPPRVCDLRFDSKRFIKYFDALEITANTADELDSSPDTRDFAELAKRLSLMEECQHDVDLVDHRWYFITQLPEFTVCEECYDEVIYPLVLEKRKAIPAMFTKSPQRIPRASCQLYSEKMRDVLTRAVEADDYKYLASKARERRTVELAYKANVIELKRRIGSLGLLGGNEGALTRELNRTVEEWKKWE